MLNKELMMMGAERVGTLTVDTTQMDYHFVEVFFTDGNSKRIESHGIYKYPNNAVAYVTVSPRLDIIELMNMYKQSTDTYAILLQEEDALIRVTLGSS